MQILIRTHLALQLCPRQAVDTLLLGEVFLKEFVLCLIATHVSINLTACYIILFSVGSLALFASLC